MDASSESTKCVGVEILGKITTLKEPEYLSISCKSAPLAECDLDLFPFSKAYHGGRERGPPHLQKISVDEEHLWGGGRGFDCGGDN